MEVALTWDLLVMIFFVVIMSYSYIVGLSGTVKIILSSYIAMLAANGIGNLASRYIVLSEPIIKVLSDDPVENVVIFKIFIFIIITLILVLKGGFLIDLPRNDSLMTRFVITSGFGFLSAGLIMSTILLFIAGASVEGGMLESIQAALNIPDRTLFVHLLFKYYNFWFAAPAVAFVALSVVNPVNDPLIEE